MPLNPTDWHKRFALQAGWTSNTRQYLFKLAGAADAKRVLDVGSGTGALSGEIASRGIQFPVGIDFNPDFITLAADQAPDCNFAIADAHDLPFKQGIFDISFCHFVLMWVADPLEVLKQMARVTRPGSAVLALAEPDYGGRIDYPRELEIINQWQSAGIRHLGGDPNFGRQIKGLFHQAGFSNIETGVIGAQWKAPPSREDIESEWKVIHHDLSTLGKENSEFSKNSEGLKNLDIQSWANGERILYVPTFYVLGRVPPGH